MKYQTPAVRVGLARRGWTQAELARQLEITDGYLIDILAGRRKSLFLQRRIAKLLRLQLDEVVQKQKRSM